MAKRDRDGIGGVRRRKTRWQTEQGLHHRTDLILASRARASDRLLDLVRRILRDIAPGTGRLGHGQAARHAHAHRRRDIVLKQHPFDRDDVGTKFDDQGTKFCLHLRQPVRKIERWVGANHPGSNRPRATTMLDTAIATPRETGIDSQHEHVYDPSARPSGVSSPHRAAMNEPRPAT